MEFETTRLEGVMLVRPRMFEDDRGSFTEAWNVEAFAETVGESVQFKQSNESVSRAGVLRGMHFQIPPRGQGKLVRVTRGRVLDVAVDLRKESSTFGQHVAVELSAENRWQLWIPVGFAHGFWRWRMVPPCNTTARTRTIQSLSKAWRGTTQTWASTGGWSALW